MIHIRVSPAPIDIAAEQARVEQGGAVATFTGLVRADDGVEELALEHYPGATEA
ncbi:MAG: molybdenum cofactor biosynthesis protein MoaE, partial [Sphingomonas sp.]|nr:molybdenum cofactor biosynthesis protein MoaE [Sphingomonas sp.]